MRIRSIKPEFWEDEVMASLHPHARLLFIATWQLADKNGVLEHRPAWIKAKVFPYEDWEAIGKHLGSTREAPGNTNFDGVLRSLIDHGFLVEFTADGRDYLYVRNFKKHQRINGKEAVAKSVNPCPPTDIELEKQPSESGKHPRSTREAPEKHPGAQEQGAGKCTPLPPANGGDLAPLVGEDSINPNPKPAKTWEPTPEQRRLNALFRRRDTTEWDIKEVRALKKLLPIPEDDFALIEGYYTASFPEGKDFRRHDLATLLNNWRGELDRARKYAEPRSAQRHGDDMPDWYKSLPVLQ